MEKLQHSNKDRIVDKQKKTNPLFVHPSFLTIYVVVCAPAQDTTLAKIQPQVRRRPLFPTSRHGFIQSFNHLQSQQKIGCSAG